MSAPETIGYPSHASENPRRSRLLWSHLENVRSFRMNHKNVIRKTGSGAAEFFSKYLKPHYKELAAAGLVSAYLVAPERFHDAAGHLTESATWELTRLGIEVGSAASRGFWNGIRSKFDENPVFSLVGIVAILTCLVLTLPRVRWHLFRAIRPLFTTPTSDSSNAEFRSSPSRRFEE